MHFGHCAYICLHNKHIKETIMENIEISKYLTDYNRPTNCGKCRSCDKPVQWTKERLASHKRSSCPNASAEEKRLFAKRKRELSSLPSTSVQDQITQPIQVSQELLNC
ncbi:hypothetical protein PVAND_002616 [Polypedilum vanderplanki]|uniref:Uncharacterized protein n=1 Tax=Polypedilum vanderplanki TaxID=319348 RepID=A0A9J6BRX3_POLVA|nr:hypothetical protein PVAND_002616 [Polypedilum vanderplanki]